MTLPYFDNCFRSELADLIAWRRDVRRFRRDPVPAKLVAEALRLAQLSPSVGNSQPWRLVKVNSTSKREAVRANFRDANAAALAAQTSSRASAYAQLKLEGIDIAPVQFAVFCDHGTAQGHGLGALTMPETLDYSVVSMISILWLAARAHGLGLGWVSILDPERICVDMGVPASYKFIAYICLGWPEDNQDIPELERSGWQERTLLGTYIMHV